MMPKIQHLVVFLFGEIFDWNLISHNCKFAEIFACNPTFHRFSEIFDQNSMSQSLIWGESDQNPISHSCRYLNKQGHDQPSENNKIP